MKLGLVLIVFVSVIGFVGAKGFVGITTSGQVDLQGGNSRPSWKSPPGVAARMVWFVHHVGSEVDMKWSASEQTACELQRRRKRERSRGLRRGLI